MNTGGTTSNSYVAATGGTAQAGIWAQLTFTYSTAGGADILADTQPPSATGAFVLGTSQASGSYGSYLTGELADVQVWHTAATPLQPPTAGSKFVPITPVRIMDTRSSHGPIGPVTGPVATDGNTLLPIDGNTIASLPASVTAVAVSVTITGQTAGGVAPIAGQVEYRWPISPDGSASTHPTTRTSWPCSAPAMCETTPGPWP